MTTGIFWGAAGEYYTEYVPAAGARISFPHTVISKTALAVPPAGIAKVLNVSVTETLWATL